MVRSSVWRAIVICVSEAIRATVHRTRRICRGPRGEGWQVGGPIIRDVDQTNSDKFFAFVVATAIANLAKGKELQPTPK